MHAKGFSKQSKLILTGIAAFLIIAVVILVICLNHKEAAAEPTPTPTPVTVQDAIPAPEVVEDVEPTPEPEPIPEPIPEPVVAYMERTYYDVPLDLEFQFFVIELCEEHGIDPVIVFSMMDTESDFTASIIGDNGNSYGLMQIQPRWHTARMERLGVTDLLDPYQNVTVGVDLLAELAEHGRDTSWILMAYNGGVAHANEFLVEGRISYYAHEVLTQAEALRTSIQVGTFRSDDLYTPLPVCADCGNAIKDDVAYCINDEWICEACVDSCKQDVVTG